MAKRSARRSPLIWTPAQSRRSFLRAGSLAAAGIGLGLGAGGCSSEGEVVDGVPTGPWASIKEGGEGLMPPVSRRPEGVLELFLFGGLCPWDSFYVVPEFGDPAAGGPTAGSMWWAFQDTIENVSDQFARCGGADRPLLESSPWASDSAGRGVYLGPWLYPLRERPDIINRMRMWVMRHDQAAHETGVPLAMCGLLHSSPRLASTAAHVQRFFADRQDESRRTPWSTVVYPGLSDLSALNGEVASAVGLHGAAARPVSLRLGANGLTSDGLDRATVAGRTDALDDLVRYYGERMGSRLVPPGAEEAVRAPRMKNYEAARRALERADAFQALLGEDAFVGAEGEDCGDYSERDFTTMSLRLALNLMTHPTDAPKWTTVLDGGLLPAVGGAAYDTHFKHVHHSSRNTVHTMKELVARINEPGEGDPNKLDLDKHTVLLTTEFGRTPHAVGDGLNHWVDGYVVVGFGGPFDEENSGIVGAIGENGAATESISPGDFRTAMLQMQGMWPFSAESFSVSETTAATDDEFEGVAYLAERVLGYQP
ncbi:MAG: hypothetical protein GY898_16215 [Proteobacteria bacterium]|nr:hypothetical protein [Pseudomonadota bacterium]